MRVFPFVFAAGVLFGATGAFGQTKLREAFSHVDLGLQGVGQFSSTASGPVTIPAYNQGQTVSISPSNTVGFLGTLRYTPRPYVGAEFNGSYARYTEDLNVQVTANGALAIQTQVNEFSLGYLITPPYTIFGVRPYASAGVGGIRFVPTRGGGQGAPSQGRVGEYYSIGVQKDLIPDTFGVRVGYRQLFFVAPDFFQNYLTINKRTYTSEPLVGFYLRF